MEDKVLKTLELGTTFNSLTVIGHPFFKSKTTKKGELKKVKFVSVRCICGTEKEIDLYSLTSGHVKTCGCSRVPSLIGQVFGRWTVIAISSIKHTSKRGFMFECLCECGTTKVVHSQTLLSGDSKSCGCLNDEVRKTPKPQIRGENHPMYKGDVQVKRAIRGMSEVDKWRVEVFLRDSRECQVCHMPTREIQAHHIIFLSTIIERFNITCAEEARMCPLLWDTDNGITLCESCHKLVHSAKSLYTIC